MSRLSPKLFLGLYGLVLCLLAPLRPLWLDELIQLSDTYRHSLPETVDRVAHNPGGVPLAYLAENLLVNGGGHPFYTAHVFPILCAVGGLASLIWLTRLLGASAGWLHAALLFATLPILLRYAVEARQYGPALALSVAATALACWVDTRPAWWRAAIYGAVLALGIYAQPYVAFMAAAHCLWALRRSSTRYIFGGCLIAGLAFLPWYLYARGFWVQAVAEAGYQSSFSARTPLLILRELSGGGYFLTSALLGLAVYGYLRTGMARESRELLLLWVVTPLPLVVAANLLFHYFFAIRQILFVLPPLCLLVGEGLWALRPRWRAVTATALALLAVSYDVRWFTHYREDWGAAAATAKKLVAGSCLNVVPVSAYPLYALYEPTLPVCQQPAAASLLLVSPYAGKVDLDGLRIAQQFEIGGSTVIILR